MSWKLSFYTNKMNTGPKKIKKRDAKKASRKASFNPDDVKSDASKSEGLFLEVGDGETKKLSW